MASAIETKLYVTNFPSAATRQQLQQFFSRFGRVQECAIMWNSYAFIHYATMDEARRALDQSNGALFLNRKLIVQLSTSRFRPQPKEMPSSPSPKQLMFMSHHPQQSNSSISPTYSNEINYDFLARSSPILDGPVLYSNLPIDRITPHNPLQSDLSHTGELPKLYCTNLPDNCQTNDLQRLFSSFGHVVDCVILWDYYAFVTFQNFQEAERALHALHGFTWKDRRLIVEWSRASGRRQQQQQTSTPSSPRSRQFCPNNPSFNQNLAMISLLQQQKQQQMPFKSYSNSPDNQLDLSPFVDSPSATSLFSPSSEHLTPTSPTIYQPSDIIALLEPTNSIMSEITNTLPSIPNLQSSCSSAASMTGNLFQENFLSSLFHSFEPFNKYLPTDEPSSSSSRYNSQLLTTAPDLNHQSLSFAHNA